MQIVRQPVKAPPPVTTGRRYAGHGQGVSEAPLSPLSPLNSRKTQPTRPSKLPVVAVYNPRQSVTSSMDIKNLKPQRKMTPPSSDETMMSKPTRTGKRIGSPSWGSCKRGETITAIPRRRSPSLSRSVSIGGKTNLYQL